MSQRADPVLFAEFTGLKNTITEERLAPTELAVATNVDIDKAGQVRRRRGYTKVLDGAFHSLWRGENGALVVKDGDLCSLRKGYATTVLAASVGDRPLAYCDVGPSTYYASETASGYILEGVNFPWGQISGAGSWESPVQVPTDYLQQVGGLLTGPPPHATSLTYFNGRIYLANDRVVWATELYRYGVVDKTRNYLYFEAPVTEVFAVPTGLFVSTTEAVYFLTGTFREMRRREVFPSGVIPRSVVRVSTDTLDSQRLPQGSYAYMVLTHDGVCVAGDSGVCYSLTEDAVKLPHADTAAAMLRKQDSISQYVGVTNSSGTPTSKARFGDHVDVEIVRFRS